MAMSRRWSAHGAAAGESDPFVPPLCLHRSIRMSAGHDTKEEDSLECEGSGGISSDTPCGWCGYNLRGLKPTGLCPECGKPVCHSLRRQGERQEMPSRLFRWCRAAYVAAVSICYAVFAIALVLWPRHSHWDPWKLAFDAAISWSRGWALALFAAGGLWCSFDRHARKSPWVILAAIASIFLAMWVPTLM